MSSIEHVNVKVFAREPVGVNWADLIPVFHRWIQRQVFPDVLLIDVADYAVVPAGPGVMLIGHHANISLDNRQNRVGMLYNRKTVMEGSFADKLRHSYEGALAAAHRLVQEPEFLGKIAFDDSDLEVFVNDRLLAPNTQETWEKLRGDIEAMFGPGATLAWNNAARELFRVSVKAAVASPAAL
jgi:hypothetical protein